jgi:hypothetical protein
MTTSIDSSIVSAFVAHKAAKLEIEITSSMIEASGKCLRAHLKELSYGESELLAEKALRAALGGRPY